MLSTLRNSAFSLVRKVRGSPSTTVVRIRLLTFNSNNRGRIRDHDKVNSNSAQRPQERSQNNERAAASALRREAQLEHSLADRWNNDPLREEAELTQVIADLLEQDRAKMKPTLTGQNRQQRQKDNTSAQAQQALRANGQQHSRAQQQQQIPEFSNQASVHREGVFKSAYELKLDAAVKQSIASRTHDQQLMNEAKIEQSIADSLSPSIGGQPLYGTGPGGVKHHNHNSRQTEQNGVQQPVQNVEQAQQQPQQSAQQQQFVQQQELPQNKQYNPTQENNFQTMQNFKRSDDLWEQIIVEFSDEVSRSTGDQRGHDNAKYERWL